VEIVFQDHRKLHGRLVGKWSLAQDLEASVDLPTWRGPDLTCRLAMVRQAWWYSLGGEVVDLDRVVLKACREIYTQ
jgi:hypothetical protein